jgi:anti-sigma factor ChrR (cupin superfamily)
MHMGESHVVEQLIAYVSGNLDDATTRLVREHLAACAACRRESEAQAAFWETLGGIPEEQPGRRVGEKFHEMLTEYAQGERDRREAPLRVRPSSFLDRFRFGRPAFQVAFGVCMIALGAIGGYLAGGGRENREELAQLREEVHGLGNLLTVSLLHQESASERLKGVSLSTSHDGPDPDIVAALVSTMKHDRNVNVRIAALDALSREIGTPDVRREVIHALPDQTSPLMQIALVDVLVQINDGESREVLQEVMKKPGLLPDVRKRMQQGIQQIL